VLFGKTHGEVTEIMGDRPIGRVARSHGVRLGIAVALLAGCGRIGFDEGRAEPDAAVGPAQSSTCDPTAPFGPAVRIAELSGASRDRALRLMPDELSGYVASDRAGDGAESIYMVARADARRAFSIASEPVLAIASEPALAGDGTFVLFERGADIWIAAREGLDELAAIGVAAELSTGALDAEPYVQPTGDDVYFASDRDGNGGDLYHALRVGSSFVVPARIAELATAFDEGAPVVSVDGRELFFRSDRPAALGGANIYVAERATAEDVWGPPALVIGASSDASDEPSWLSIDRCRLYLTSDRDGSADVYVATRAY